MQNPFGTVAVDFQAYTEEGMQTEFETKRIFEKSAFQLKGLIPIHTHKGGPRNRPYTETLILKKDDQNHDVRILTIANGHWEDMTEDEVKNLLARQTPMVPGLPYNCGEGLAHAIVNVAGWLEPDDKLPVIMSEKFYMDRSDR